MIDASDNIPPAEFNVAMLVALDVVIAILELCSVSAGCQRPLAASPSMMCAPSVFAE